MREAPRMIRRSRVPVRQDEQGRASQQLRGGRVVDERLPCAEVIELVEHDRPTAASQLEIFVEA
jgi:hypothetical protein